MALYLGSNKVAGIGGSSESTPDIYSTEEQVVGTWIDDKPVYRKVIQTGACSLSTTTTWFSIGIANVANVVHMEFYYKYKGSTDEIWYSKWNLKEIGYNVATKKFGIATNSSASFTDSILILEYTKTTD